MGLDSCQQEKHERAVEDFVKNMDVDEMRKNKERPPPKKSKWPKNFLSLSYEKVNHYHSGIADLVYSSTKLQLKYKIVLQCSLILVSFKLLYMFLYYKT